MCDLQKQVNLFVETKYKIFTPVSVSLKLGGDVHSVQDQNIGSGLDLTPPSVVIRPYLHHAAAPNAPVAEWLLIPQANFHKPLSRNGNRFSA